MHSSQELSTNDFVVEVEGKRIASIANLVPDFNVQDRLGIVVRNSLDGIWASALITAMVTAFYDQRTPLNGQLD